MTLRTLPRRARRIAYRADLDLLSKQARWCQKTKTHLLPFLYSVIVPQTKKTQAQERYGDGKRITKA